MLMTFEQAIEFLVTEGELDPQRAYLLVPRSTYQTGTIAQEFMILSAWGSKRGSCIEGQEPVFMKGCWDHLINCGAGSSKSYFGYKVFQRWIQRKKPTIESRPEAAAFYAEFERLCESKPEKRGTYLTRHNQDKLPRRLYERFPDGGRKITVEGEQVFLDDKGRPPEVRAKLAEPELPAIDQPPAPQRVYVLSNPSMPDMVKIGMTTKTAKQRADQLFNTGVPTPFIVEAEIVVENANGVERELHKLFGDSRVDQSREYFQLGDITVEDIKTEMAKYGDLL